MPNLPLPQLLFLSAAIACFVVFGVTLLCVSVWVTWLPPKAKALPREVTPARRVGALTHV
jgi:hypothetical protein